jgi:hypothetical protein
MIRANDIIWEARIKPVDYQMMMRILKKWCDTLTPEVDPRREWEPGEYNTTQYEPDIQYVNKSKLGISFWIRDMSIDQRAEFQELVKSNLEKYGWYLEFIDDAGNSYQIRPNYDKEVYVPRFLYHGLYRATPEKIDSILKKGLIPSRGENYGISYPPRVFFMTRPDMWVTYFVVFQIDTHKLGRNVKFYEDPHAENAVWTYAHIPPQAVSVYKNISDQ